MTYKEKVSAATKLFLDYKAQVLDAFGEYLAESGIESKLKEEFGNMNFFEIKEYRKSIHEKLGEIRMGFSQTVLKESHFYSIPQEVIDNFYDYNGSFIKHAPEFYALAKACDCTWHSSYKDAVTEPIFPGMLECMLNTFPTRFDDDIKTYYIETLTYIKQNQPEAFIGFDTQYSKEKGWGSACDAFNELINSIPIPPSITDEL